MDYRVISADDHIEESFRDVPATTRRRILCENARELHGL